MNPTLVELQNAFGQSGRDLLREYISKHPSWSLYRQAHGLDMGTMAMQTLRTTATCLYNGDMLTPPQVAQVAMPVTLDPTPIETPPHIPATSNPDTNSGSLEDAILDLVKKRGAIQAPVIDETRIADMIDAALKDALERSPITTIRVQTPDGNTTTLEGHHHPLFTTLLKAMSARKPNGQPIPVWLSGPAGSAKTYSGHAAAKAFGLRFYHQGALLMPHELLGFVDAAGNYHSTPFVDCYRNGGVCLLDEVDSGENAALLALKGALTNGHVSLPNGEYLERHKDCYILAAANTWGLGATADYIGRNRIDAAFLDEFVKINWTYDEKLERAICGNPDWAILVQKARAMAKSKELKVVISPRASIHGAALLAAGFTEQEAKAMTFEAGLNADQLSILNSTY